MGELAPQVFCKTQGGKSASSGHSVDEQCTTHQSRKERERRKRQNSLPAFAPNGNDTLAKNSPFSFGALPGLGLSSQWLSAYIMPPPRGTSRLGRGALYPACTRSTHCTKETKLSVEHSSPPPDHSCCQISCGSDRQTNGLKCLTAVHYCVPNANGPFIKNASASSTPCNQENVC